MRDLDSLIDEFRESGLISDGFVRKLASQTAAILEYRIKQAVDPVKTEQAVGGLRSFFGSDVGRQLLGGLIGVGTGALGTAATLGVQKAMAPKPTMMQRAMEFMAPAASHLAIAGALGSAAALKNVMMKAIDNQTINASYSQMMQQFPDLQKADPKLVQRTFNVVNQYAPSVAKNPTVSGTFVKGILQFPDAAVTPEHIRSLVGVEREMSGLHQDGFLDELGSSAAHELGQSAVRSMAPDPMKMRELKLKEEDAARRSSMDQLTKVRTLADMFTGGMRTVRDMQEPSFQEQERIRNEFRSQSDARQNDFQSNQNALKMMMQQAEARRREQLAKDQYSQRADIHSKDYKQRERFHKDRMNNP